MSPNIKILIIIIVIIIVLYLIFTVKEGFDNTTPVISLKDVNSLDDKTAINTLAQISKSLMDGTLTVPGDIKITGNVITNKLTADNINVNGKITSNNKGFMYLKFKLGGGVLTHVVDPTNMAISAKDYVCFTNILNVTGMSSNGTVYVNKTDNNWWMFNPYPNANYINVLCIPTSFFAFNSLALDDSYNAWGTSNTTRNITGGYSIQDNNGNFKQLY